MFDGWLAMGMLPQEKPGFSVVVGWGVPSTVDANMIRNQTEYARSAYG